MKELTGRPVAENIKETSIRAASSLQARGISPRLAIVRMGERPDDLAYERSLEKAAKAIGISVEVHELPEDAGQEILKQTIDGINEDERVHGCLIFRPLPSQIDEESLCDRLDPAKDVDGIGAASLASVFMGGDEGFAPATAEACMRLLQHYSVDLAGKEAVVVGRSLVIGKPVGMLLLAQDATVTYCHSRTADLKAVMKRASVVICCTGRPRFFDGSFFSEGQVVLDVGMNVDAQGALCGDVDTESVAPVVGALTPVPGGIGSVTTSVLLSHVIMAAERDA